MPGLDIVLQEFASPYQSRLVHGDIAFGKKLAAIAIHGHSVRHDGGGSELGFTDLDHDTIVGHRDVGGRAVGKGTLSLGDDLPVGIFPLGCLPHDQ